MKITPPNQGPGLSYPGGTSSGPAGGDLGGTLPGPTVTGVQGVPVCVDTPVLGDVLTFNGTEWCPASGGGSGGTFLTTTYGEQAKLVISSAAGAAYAIDCSLGNTFDLTLTANCTISIINPAASGVDSHIVVALRQGGSGSYTVTWPAAVKWQSATGTNTGSAPTLWTAVGAQDVVELSTEDGGTTWGGYLSPHPATASFGTPAIVLGTAAAAGSASTAVRTDATIIAFDSTVGTPIGTASAGSNALASRNNHVHNITGTLITSLGFTGPLLVNDGITSPPEPLYTEDGTDFLYADVSP